MELLRHEMERKKRERSEMIEKTTSELKIGSSRFVRQADVAQIELQKQIDAQKKLDEERCVRQKTSDIRGLSNEQGSKLSKLSLETEKQEKLRTLKKLTLEQIQQRLRACGQPITLFGESSEERLERLSNLEDEEKQDDELLISSVYAQRKLSGGVKGSSSTEYDIIDNKEDDDGDDDEDPSETISRKLKERKDKAHRERQHEEDDVDCGSDADSEKDEDQDVKKSKRGPPNFDVKFSEIPDMTARKVIQKYFKLLLKMWEWDLNDREDIEKRCAKGRNETQKYKQCKDHIRPLFKLCKKNQVPYDIEVKLAQMVKFCEAGNFRAAHDEYLRAAIGNAAWPIGLTMVGIHERSGRERISSSKIAHVMNNELQRKYFTSVKRLMTFAQTKRPDVAPSMKVLG